MTAQSNKKTENPILPTFSQIDDKQMKQMWNGRQSRNKQKSYNESSEEVEFLISEYAQKSERESKETEIRLLFADQMSNQNALESIHKITLDSACDYEVTDKGPSKFVC